MSFAPSSPVTGGPQTGLTSPTYTIGIDTAPSANGKQYAVTTLGGTQTGVEVSSTSNPFTITMFKVASPKSLPVLNPVTGVLSNVPKNTYKLIVRKGIEVMSGQPRQILLCSLDIAVPANADVQDPESVRVALSLIVGTLWANSAAIGDVLIQNLL